jgi:hypothetical protein
MPPGVVWDLHAGCAGWPGVLVVDQRQWWVRGSEVQSWVQGLSTMCTTMRRVMLYACPAVGIAVLWETPVADFVRDLHCTVTHQSRLQHLHCLVIAPSLFTSIALIWPQAMMHPLTSEAAAAAARGEEHGAVEMTWMIHCQRHARSWTSTSEVKGCCTATSSLHGSKEGSCRQ